MQTPDPPDSLGRITIRFNTSRPVQFCNCRINRDHESCTNYYVADPRNIGGGTHNISIKCMLWEGDITIHHVKLTLPPPQPQGREFI